MFRYITLTITCVILISNHALAQNQAFLKGGDVSMLQTIEDHGGVYKQDGAAKDPLAIFKDHGANAMRLRLFHSPTGVPPRVNDLAYTQRLGRRIKQTGMQLLLDIHYSDTWADPAHQTKPQAWENLSFDELQKAVFNYTRDVIIQMKNAGAMPDIVQIGNEIGPGFLWDSGRIGGKTFNNPKQWRQLAQLLQAGIDGAREGAGNNPLQTMIHIQSGGDVQQTRRFFDSLAAHKLDFDIIGLSYYPWWHSDGRGLEPLRENLKATIKRFNKDVMVVETAYPWKPNNPNPTKIKHRNQLRPLVPGFPPSPQGQKDYLKNILQVIRQAPNNRGRGLFYWAPEYIPSPQLQPGREHLSLFDENGSALPGINAFRK